VSQSRIDASEPATLRPWGRRSVKYFQSYGLAIVSVGIALGVSLLLVHFHFRDAAAPLLLFAVAISSWFGGPGPAALAVVLSIVSFYWYFIEPVRTIYIYPSEVPYFIVFAAFALLISWFSAIRRRAEGSLREQANLLNLTHDAIFVIDMDGMIKYWNRGAEEHYGWTVEQAVDRDVHDMLKTVFPAPLGEIKAEIMRTGRWEGELVHTKKDGTQVVVASRWALQRDERGAAIAILETNNDITERKQAEKEREQLRQLKADLAHMDRVSVLGELAASLSHELKQPIAAAIINANTGLRWLKRDVPDIERAQEAVARIVQDGKRAADIIDRLRSLYKKGVLPEPELVDVNQILCEILALLRGEALRYPVFMHTDLAAELPKVRADRIQLQQVLLNLMLNGIEAMKDGGGELTITSQLGEAGYILISIGDTGVGLPAQNADQIFNAFFTTKPQGSGMGLAISRSIVESHGGHLWATNNSGRGATFHFTLPIAGRPDTQ